MKYSLMVNITMEIDLPQPLTPPDVSVEIKKKIKKRRWHAKRRRDNRKLVAERSLWEMKKRVKRGETWRRNRRKRERGRERRGSVLHSIKARAKRAKCWLAKDLPSTIVQVWQRQVKKKKILVFHGSTTDVLVSFGWTGCQMSFP